jgi:hypothetical protein
MNIHFYKYDPETLIFAPILDAMHISATVTIIPP